MKRLNGVNVDKLTATVKAVQNDPALGNFKFRARSEWQGGGKSKTVIKDFYGTKREICRSQAFAMTSDEPVELLGDNTAINAVEAVLYALASCLTVGVAYNAAARGITLKSLAFDLEGELDSKKFLGLDGKRAGYDAIRVHCHINSDATPDQLEELMTYVQETSPVLDIIANPVPVALTVN